MTASSRYLEDNVNHNRLIIDHRRIEKRRYKKKYSMLRSYWLQKQKTEKSKQVSQYSGQAKPFPVISSKTRYNKRHTIC